MKRTVYLCVCLLMLGAGVTTALGQGTTIDATDVGDFFRAGRTITYNIDTLTSTANIGASGASSWDFSGLATHTRMVLKSVDPAGTPYFASNFPAATHALSDTAFTYSFWFADLSSTVTLKGAGYNYMTLGTDLLDYGFKGSGNAFIQNNPFPAEGQWVKSPAAIYYGLPMQMGKTWTTSYNEVLSGTATILGMPFKVGPDTTAHTVTYTVDAYGLLTVPGSPAADALRMRKEDRYSTKTAQNQLRVGYVFIAKNGASVQLTATDPMAADNGTIGATSIQWNGPTPTAVRTITNIPGVFQLGQNYPNPFNPSTTIRFTLPDRQQVTLAVYNLLGERVATLVNGMVDAGESSVQFDGAGLASGVYLYKLQAGTSVQTRRMMLVK